MTTEFVKSVFPHWKAKQIQEFVGKFENEQKLGDEILEEIKHPWQSAEKKRSKKKAQWKKKYEQKKVEETVAVPDDEKEHKEQKKVEDVSPTQKRENASKPKLTLNPFAKSFSPNNIKEGTRKYTLQELLTIARQKESKGALQLPPEFARIRNPNPDGKEVMKIVKRLIKRVKNGGTYKSVPLLPYPSLEQRERCRGPSRLDDITIPIVPMVLPSSVSLSFLPDTPNDDLYTYT